MGTKNNPGKHDPQIEDWDEPFFILRGKDPLAPNLVRLWEALRAHDIGCAHEITKSLVYQAKLFPKEARASKLGEARQCARDMLSWRERTSQHLAYEGGPDGPSAG